MVTEALNRNSWCLYCKTCLLKVDMDHVLFSFIFSGECIGLTTPGNERLAYSSRNFFLLLYQILSMSIGVNALV